MAASFCAVDGVCLLVLSAFQGLDPIEVESIYVVNESVSVIIYIIASFLTFIHPKCTAEIFVYVVDSKVKYSHNYARVSCAEPPCILNSYVRSFYGFLMDGAVIDKVPLKRKVFVVKW